MAEYQQIQGQVGYESPSQEFVRQGTVSEGGGPHEQGLASSHPLIKQKVKKQEIPAKGRIIGSMYPYITRGMAPSGGDDPPPQVKRNILQISLKMKTMKKMRKVRQMNKLSL